jgi:hypothetical protein
MSQRAATIVSLPMAVEVVKAMQVDNLDWGEDYRPFSRQALAEIIEDQMGDSLCPPMVVGAVHWIHARRLRKPDPASAPRHTKPQT